MYEIVIGNTNEYKNLNINGNTTADANFDYNNLIANNGETTQNGLVEGNNYDYNYNFSTTENQNGNNWTSSAQSSYTTTNIVQTTSQYNPEINYQMETQGFPVEQGEQIQYGN